MAAGIVSAIVGAVDGAAIGVFGPYYFDLRKSQRAQAEREQEAKAERERHRSAVATAIIQDLRELEGFSRQMYDSDRPTSAVVTRPRRYFDALRAETRWFTPSSIHPIAEVFRLADLYYDSIPQLREIGGGRIRATPEREFELRASAGFILQAIPTAVTALRAEGGVLEDRAPNWSPANYPDLPPIPAPVFAQTRARIANSAEG